MLAHEPIVSIAQRVVGTILHAESKHPPLFAVDMYKIKDACIFIFGPSTTTFHVFFSILVDNLKSREDIRVRKVKEHFLRIGGRKK